VSGRVWRIGVAGLGVVGGALLKVLLENPDFAPVGDCVRVTAVSARTRKDRGVDLSNVQWFDDPAALARSPDVDVFVELMGGAEGPAKAAVQAALERGKPVVTANKALIATHGLHLARLAETHAVPLLYEAAVMGGVPAVKMLREGLTGEAVTSVAGILNGTCNFILSEMERTERGFAEVLAEAQKLGYAEADPTTDVGGFDAAHKIAILAALAFGGAPNLEAVEIDGIAAVDLIDIRLARDLGYRIKLIASAERSGAGAVIRQSRARPAQPSTGACRGRAQRPLHRGAAHRPHLYARSWRRRNGDRRRRRRRHRRRHDRGDSPSVSKTGRRSC
jgi:homoserine dehydrogenase